MEVFEAIKSRRTIRKFKQIPIKHDDIVKMIECARVYAAAANLQPLKYVIVDEKAKEIYPLTKWAGYIPDWTPAEDESPMCYIAVITDTSIKPADKAEVDCGAAITNMMLGAKGLNLDTCWLGAIDRDGIKTLLGLDEKYYVSYLLAVGIGDQSGKIFDIKDNNIKYYFDDNGNVSVPKRTMDEIILK